MEYDRAQLRELLTHYGPIDILFIDGAAKVCASSPELQPNIVEGDVWFTKRKNEDTVYEKDETWRDTPLATRSAPGRFTAAIEGLRAGETYEFRAMVKHPLLTVSGEEKAMSVR